MTMDHYRSSPSSSSVGPSTHKQPHPTQRIKISCIPCRRRKTKCDGETPCSSCVLRESSQTCHYPDHCEAQQDQTPTSQPTLLSSQRGDAQQATQRRPRSGSSKERQNGTAAFDNEKGLAKRRRKSDSGERGSSYVPLDGPVSHNDLDKILDGLLHHVDSVKRAVTAHRCDAGSSHDQDTPPLPHSLPHRCSDSLLQRMVALLPPQVDCEVMLEYLIQEPDWFVVSVTGPYLLPIWSRFIYGARLRDVEVVVLAAAISVAATLLSEYPHDFYPLTAPLGSVASDLMDLVFHHLRYTPKSKLRHGGLQRQDLVDEMVVSGLSLDYLRFCRKRSEAWTWFREHLTIHIETFELMNDESSSTWQSFDALERDMVRRVLWHTILTARMSHLYREHPDFLEIRPEKIKIKRPQFPGPMSGPGAFVFKASAVGLDAEQKIQLRCPTKSVVRVHVEKTVEDIERSAKCQELSVQLTSKVPAIRSYVSAFKSWQAHRRKLLRAKGKDERGAALPTSPFDVSPTSLDHRRKDLLHQALTVTRDIKHWRDTWVLKEVPRLTRLDDARDYLNLRQANRSSLLHIAIIQCISAILTPWLTEDVGNNDGRSDSPLLMEVQREAYENVREIVVSIDATRSMITSGLITYFGSFAAYAFFYAAVSLAVPLVGALALRQEPRDAKGRYGDIMLLDRYTDLKFQQEDSRDGCDADEALLADEEQISSYSAPATSIHFTAAELRAMAGDLIKILDVLPIFRASPLCSEARQRLSYLVDTFRIKRRAEGVDAIPDRQLAAATVPAMLSPSSITFDSFGLSVFGDSGYNDFLGSSRMPGTDMAIASVAGAAYPNNSTWSLSTPTTTSSASGEVPASLSSTVEPTPPAHGGDMIDTLIQMDNNWWENLLGVAATDGREQQR